MLQNNLVKAILVGRGRELGDAKHRDRPVVITRWKNDVFIVAGNMPAPRVIFSSPKLFISRILIPF